jgi:hypothetical protein
MASCGKDDCREMICDLNYESITVEIINSMDDPMLLDSSYSIHLKSGMVYHNNQLLILHDRGSYILWTDGELDITEKDGSKIRFEGWQSGKKVISEDYVIGHDCCHVELIEGNESIILV